MALRCRNGESLHGYRFGQALPEGFQSAKGMYVLNRTSNPGARDLQGLTVADNMVENITDTDTTPARCGRPEDRSLGCGTGRHRAVVGAPACKSWREIASFYAARGFLCSSGGRVPRASAKATMQVLRKPVIRWNSPDQRSSALTHPGKRLRHPRTGWSSVWQISAACCRRPLCDCMEQDTEAVRSYLAGRSQRTLALQTPVALATVSGVLSTKTPWCGTPTGNFRRSH